MQVNDDEVLVPLTSEEIEILIDALDHAMNFGYTCGIVLVNKLREMLYGN